MTGRTVACTNCSAPIATDLLDGIFHMCPTCQVWFRVHLFPAFATEASTPAAEPLLIEGESSCYYHPQKKAVLGCESCGRFLCALCDIEIGGVHRCPRCLEAGKRKQELDALEMQHTRYDWIALT